MVRCPVRHLTCRGLIHWVFVHGGIGERGGEMRDNTLSRRWTAFAISAAIWVSVLITQAKDLGDVLGVVAAAIATVYLVDYLLSE